MAGKVSTELRGLRAKTAFYDDTERELEQTRRSDARDGIDPAWREIANALASALRPYTLFREQPVIDGRNVVEIAVSGSTLRAAREALDWLGRQVALGSYRSSGMPVREDAGREAA